MPARAGLALRKGSKGEERRGKKGREGTEEGRAWKVPPLRNDINPGQGSKEGNWSP